LGRANSGGIFIKLDRGDYWQCGLVIRKGAFEEIKQRGLAAFQDRIAFYAPLFRDRVAALDDWNKIRLLVVTVDHLRCWHAPGLLCLGDSAHAMSPIGGVGINLAIQDAVAAANVLAQPLGQGQLSQKHLARIQGRRERPTRWTQRMQLFIQKRVISGVLKSDQPLRVPLVFKLLNNFPLLRRLPGRVIGMGFRPEHVRTKARP
jgi:2-polyprenyl-6-methoxyphenol hydroxylase-like FAD-dependent oxidoreductase